ncbi:DNA ligase [Candidatus Micrarchaeota archaeon CG_4_10_14_0_2_um_filter_55_9]|nr:MAG: hypothetical protein AUJ15_00880 [Candidatus Micrarchaeota archaeon CG1_02_55_41]PIZ91484.1 MAG: DNA ligase [Candidatus Micrarchaeota archaeon CG_4_10_14_0_2_um_filter_55_9]PJD00969.1 MAG: DNA ligase [Candidatus Micrarchaeota archaeon CG10_big_fil_rev_8_21_14_0_10_54_18]
MLFSLVAETFLDLEKTSSRLETTAKLAGLFRKVSGSEAKQTIYFLQGIVAPPYHGVDLGVAEKLCEQAIMKASGCKPAEVTQLYRKTGDLGEAARILLEKKSQQTLAKNKLTISKVYDNLYKTATSSGAGSQDRKIGLLSELLSHASPAEVKIITRFVAGTTRLGTGDATIIDALSYVYSAAEKKDASKAIARAYNLSSDLGSIAEKLAENGLKAVEGARPEPFNPVRPALAERLNSAEEIIAKLGPCKADGKYDGMRLQIHSDGKRVEIYSRKQEVVTHMFPDVAREVASWKKKIIFEGEAVGYKDGAFLSFQETIQRRRKHGIKKKSEDVPIRVYAFELLYLGGEDYTLKPYEERRKALEKSVGGKTVRIAEAVDCGTAGDLKKFFDECVSLGLEGVIAKDLEAPYVAGARKFAWIKLKKSYSEALADTVDAVVVGYYYGKGKRTKFGFGGLLAAVKAGQEYRTVAKIGTGFTEEQLDWFRKTLEKQKVKQKPANVDSLVEADEWVKPSLVVEVKADEITRSPVHTCAMKDKEGLALRFPRLVRIRVDKSPAQATTEKEVIQLFEKQRQST